MSRQIPLTSTTNVHQVTDEQREYFTEIAEQTRQLFITFVSDRLARDHHDQGSIAELTEEDSRSRTVGGRRVEEIGNALQQIGDALSEDERLNQLLGRLHVTSSTAYDTFMRVAVEIFNDGHFNWGRIVTLFYFGYRLALRVLTESSIVKQIVGWITRFVYEICSFWIFEHGGWEAITDYVQWNWKASFLLIGATATLIIGMIAWKRS